MQLIGFVLFLALGLFQLAATYAGLVDWLGVPWLLAVLLSVFIGWMPLVGTVLGVLGAVYVWHWAWWQAVLLFFGVQALILGVGGFAGIVAWFSERRRLAS